MLQGEHSAILSTFIKLPFVIKCFVLSIFEWLFYTGLLYCICEYMSYFTYDYFYIRTEFKHNCLLTIYTYMVNTECFFLITINELEQSKKKVMSFTHVYNIQKQVLNRTYILISYHLLVLTVENDLIYYNFKTKIPAALQLFNMRSACRWALKIFRAYDVLQLSTHNIFKSTTLVLSFKKCISKNSFFISQPKHMLLVLKRTISIKWFL